MYKPSPLLFSLQVSTISPRVRQNVKHLVGAPMDAAIGASAELEWRVVEALKASEERGDPPLVRAIEAGRCVGVTAGPSVELGQVLVSLLCFRYNTPSLWKLLDQAMNARLLSPVHILALLTSRVIPNRRAQPEAYRLYLELLGRYGVSLSLEAFGVRRDKITKSIDEALRLSHSYGVDKLDFGQAVIFFVLTVITNLMDSILEDLGIKLVSAEKLANLYVDEPYRDLDIDSKRNMNDKIQEHREQLRKTNTLMALEVVEKITADKWNKVFLRLSHLNMPSKFSSFLERLQFIEVHQSTSQSLILINHNIVRLVSNIREVVNGECKLNRHQHLGILVNSEFGGLTSYYKLGADRSVCWISFDLLMENAMDGKHLHAISVVEILTDLTKTLQVVNHASWQETFMALWFSGLRLVQRDREPWEGPIPHLDARLCMLLSIVPLVIVSIVKEEPDTVCTRSNYEQSIALNKSTTRRHGLVSSLQLLMQYTGLLSPPPSVANAANNAAAKAAKFIAYFKNGSNVIGGSQKGASFKAVGNMLHLIVETCIARKLIDSSAYFWPGYVVQSAIVKSSMLTEESPWSTFMEGTQLTSSSLRNALMTTPASRIEELEKLYDTAINGSGEEKSAAAKILCGASLIRGWNIQEHAVHIVVKLLSTPIPIEVSGTETCSQLISRMPMLSAILFGACSVEAIHIISLYGLVPEVAAALMPLCEALGSFPPLPNHRPSPFDETSIYSVFSCAFLFLLRLWKFYKPPQEHRIAGRGGKVRLEFTLDYLLLLHNHRVAVQNSSAKDKTNKLTISPVQPVYIDSFPKLKTWYLQNQACIASTLSGLSSKNPVHLVANKILNMIYCKMRKGGNISGNPSSTSSSSISESPSTAEDAFQIPLLPAWDILEAVPFVLEAVLTACANGRLSSRDLITGLRDLADFLPASLATIVSYFSAEITRGIWEPVAMNGVDWPSPATNLQLVESEIREILASVGVTLPKCHGGATVPMLPLPMAALVSLTITFKLDKDFQYIHIVIGQALENCSAGSPWPSMPIVGALWAQKVRRWHDFIVLSATHSPFTRDKEAVAQLIRSCFSSFLGSDATLCGISGLLGQSISNQGRRLPLAPGFLYLRSCRSFYDTHFVNNVILKHVIEWTNELVVNQYRSKPSPHLLSNKSSLAAAASAVRTVAALGTSLLCVAGGPLLVQVLYEETLPSALLSWEFSNLNVHEHHLTTIRLLEGYAMAYMLVLSGAFIWGLRKCSPGSSSLFSSMHSRAVGMHMEFVAGVMEGEVSVGCDPVIWRAYVSCLIGLLVRFVPTWIPEIRKGTLRKIAGGLRGWHEWELALALLERAGPASVELVMEFHSVML